jgi:hypothetical protein
MFHHRYRLGLDRKDADCLRRLRAQGHAVVFIHESTVGHPLNRHGIEVAMLQAGLAATKKKEVVNGVAH